MTSVARPDPGFKPSRRNRRPPKPAAHRDLDGTRLRRSRVLGWQRELRQELRAELYEQVREEIFAWRLAAGDGRTLREVFGGGTGINAVAEDDATDIILLGVYLGELEPEDIFLDVEPAAMPAIMYDDVGAIVADAAWELGDG